MPTGVGHGCRVVRCSAPSTRQRSSHGLVTTAGNVSHTGVGGLTLGGGMGWLARQLGLSCDNVASYQVVTPSGELLTASAEENPDLFWGLRGGGGNFGVVTEFEFVLHPVDTRALSVEMFFPLGEAEPVLRRWRDLLPEVPREATLTAWIGTAGDWPHLPSALHGQPVVNIGLRLGRRPGGRTTPPAGVAWRCLAGLRGRPGADLPRAADGATTAPRTTATAATGRATTSASSATR